MSFFHNLKSKVSSSEDKIALENLKASLENIMMKIQLERRVNDIDQKLLHLDNKIKEVDLAKREAILDFREEIYSAKSMLEDYMNTTKDLVRDMSIMQLKQSNEFKEYMHQATILYKDMQIGINENKLLMEYAIKHIEVSKKEALNEINEKVINLEQQKLSYDIEILNEQEEIIEEKRELALKEIDMSRELLRNEINAQNEVLQSKFDVFIEKTITAEHKRKYDLLVNKSQIEKNLLKQEQRNSKMIFEQESNRMKDLFNERISQLEFHARDVDRENKELKGYIGKQQKKRNKDRYQ